MSQLQRSRTRLPPRSRLMTPAETGTRALLGAALGSAANGDEASMARESLHPATMPGSAEKAETRLLFLFYCQRRCPRTRNPAATRQPPAIGIAASAAPNGAMPRAGVCHGEALAISTGGECLRVAIARALLRRSWLLYEATSQPGALNEAAPGDRSPTRRVCSAGGSGDKSI